MKKLYFVLVFIAFIFIISGISFAATVGNAIDLDVPGNSAMLRQRAIQGTLDEYEQAVKVKASVDAEMLFSKDLNAPHELRNPEMEGNWYMVKLGLTLFDKVEPYIKLGTSDLKVKWTKNELIEVDADSGFAWGAGVKAVFFESVDWGVRLTGDAQFRYTNPDVVDISNGGTAVIDKGADFEVKEWQIALVLSKKYELPLKWQNIYIVPYTGVTFSDSNVDVSFKSSANPTTDYSLFNASDDSQVGFLFGCDILPSLRSAFLYNLEVRLLNEYALTLGATMKF